MTKIEMLDHFLRSRSAAAFYEHQIARRDDLA
jgi:hypothetical protein